MRTCLVCVDHTDAVFYEWKRVHRELEEFMRLTNPEGSLQARDLQSDKPGRNKSQNTSARSAYDPRQEKPRTELQQFMRSVADALEKSAYANEFERLIIVAEPRTLGVLKKELGPHASAKLDRPVRRDVTQLKPRELRDYLEERHII